MRVPDGEARILGALFFHSGDMLTVLMPAMTVQRRTNAQEKLKGVRQTVTVIAIERVRPIVEAEGEPTNKPKRHGEPLAFYLRS